ncbi:MAG TPA: hypothetical protein VFT87_03855 [Candidatus Saccharimonadales bacterium]|nr:hypothetical protein [Candidatus Saccharimonadales bacterium]
MGLWSKIKNAAKKVWRVTKAVVRVVVRAVITIVNSVTFGLYDLLVGFLTWPPKKLRLHVFILTAPPSSGGGDVVPGGQVVPAQTVLDAIERTKQLYKKRFNVTVKPYSKQFVEVLTEEAPPEALDFECGAGQEFGAAGEFFAKHLAGWNAIPVSGTFPVTVFVVRSLKGPLGCSMSVIGDYVVIAQPGLEDNVGLPHEIGHTCSLWHSYSSDNLMYRQSPAGEKVKWFQKNLLRSSRHVQYW